MSMKVMQRAIHRLGDLSRDQFLVAIAMAEHADADGECRTDNETIANETRLPVERVQQIRPTVAPLLLESMSEGSKKAQ